MVVLETATGGRGDDGGDGVGDGGGGGGGCGGGVGLDQDFVFFHRKF